MSKKLKISIVALLLLMMAYLFASPYLTIYQIRQALKNEDTTALAHYVDFPSVRQDLKDQFNAALLKKFPEDEQGREGSFAALGTLLASSMVDKMVDMMVSPQGVSMLLQGKKLKEGLPYSVHSQPVQAETQKQSSPQQVKYRSHYQSLNQFVVEIQQAEQRSKMNVIMQRQGLSWKVTQIQLPMQQLQ
ncbi:DUF2939 domain-containing protein [Acinetobacter colistiniresistens]|uniref:DUF2939 domain-containing protein n=1 Tax=Acinetobacter colistiniresistens TaxID=280145 RepID=UPI00211CF28A|nr:DUF2939 domain-containing protein [Acinetobacter colistiniresistens]UUM28366.1 DUF2939 domain-containing protein [Acinetobacter colistiniresistens]